MTLLVAVCAVVALALWQVAHRTSPLVRRWARSSFPRRFAGPLSVLDSGSTGRDDEEVVVILHGMGATGDYFGAFYDGLSRTRRVVIVDLFGFGHSLDEERAVFDLDTHLDALDAALAALDLDDSTVVVAAHSMSTAIALGWASRHAERVRHVFVWGPPIYRSQKAAQSVGRVYGLMGRLFMLDTKWAERACRINCAHRDLSGWAMAIISPRWPTQLSRDAGRHTWEAYHGSLRALILDADWPELVPSSVPVTVFHGTDDPIGDHEYIAELFGPDRVVEVSEADHHVALERPELLFSTIDQP